MHSGTPLKNKRLVLARGSACLIPAGIVICGGRHMAAAHERFYQVAAFAERAFIEIEPPPFQSPCRAVLLLTLPLHAKSSAFQLAVMPLVRPHCGRYTVPTQPSFAGAARLRPTHMPDCVFDVLTMIPTMNLIASHILNFIHAYQNDFAIVAAVILGVLVTLTIFTRGGRRLWIRAFRSISGPKLRFAAHERGMVWFGAVTEQRYIVSLNGIWKVSNTSRRNVTLRTFHVDGLATEHHMLMSMSGPRDGGVLIPAGEAADIEAFCLVQKTLTWRSGAFVADICFIDDTGNVHKIRRVRFNHIKQNGAAATATALSTDNREVA